jgi:hypothetical protein
MVRDGAVRVVLRRGAGHAAGGTYAQASRNVTVVGDQATSVT